MKINLKNGSRQNSIFDNNRKPNTILNNYMFSNSIEYNLKIVLSPTNYKKREINFHSKNTNNYKTTMSFLENSNFEKNNTAASPIFRKFKSVLNDFFEVPLETKINNPKFKIGCICPDVFEIPKQDLRSKLNTTRFELLKTTSKSQLKHNEKSFNSPHKFKDYTLFSQHLVKQKNDEDIKGKSKLRSESSSNFASTNGTSSKSETNNNPFFSPKSSKLTSTNGTYLKTETNNTYFSPQSTNYNSSINMFSPSTTSNNYTFSTDKKLFALVNKPNVNDSLGLRIKNYTNSNLNKTRVDMSI